MEQAISVLYQDEHLVVIDKPVGVPVHMTRGMPHDAAYVTKLLGQQLGGSFYNVHRLDAKTSGLLLLARSSGMAQQLTDQFARREVEKTYHAIVKGLPPDAGTFDLPLRKARKGKKVSAITHFRLLKSYATGIAHRDEADLSISLLELRPVTGRWHQLRQHCAQQRYDIIGDTEHGDYALNRLLAERTGVKRLYLHASQLSFYHPIRAEKMHLESDLPSSFSELLGLFSQD